MQNYITANSLRAQNKKKKRNNEILFSTKLYYNQPKANKNYVKDLFLSLLGTNPYLIKFFTIIFIPTHS